MRAGRRADLNAAVGHAQRTGTLARSRAWYGYVRFREAEPDPDDAGSVPYGLKLLLRNGPSGSRDPAA